MTESINQITAEFKKFIDDFQPTAGVQSVGSVLEAGDGIARVTGLADVRAQELVQFKNGVLGTAFNLEKDHVGVIIMGEYDEIGEGMEVRTTNRITSVPVGDALIGRVVNAIGEPIDGKGPIRSTGYRPVEYIAPGVIERKDVDQPLQTGIKAIDSMIPIGRGQRELIIGDRQTGKTAIALDTIINQKGKDVVCVYVAIGQKESTVVRVVDTLREHGAMDYTIVVNASAADPAPLQYIAPYSGVTMAEYFVYEEKRDTLCVYDDLTKQAQAYRQVSLLLRRPPGREAYPGDVFYLHSRLLERAVKLSDELGGGSLTALPIIETLEGEVSAYIPTNVISITDGQIYLRPDLFFAGIRPAIDVGISVSRVGGKAQVKAMKNIAGMLRLDLAAFRELEAFAQLGTDLDKATQAQLDRGYLMIELLKQPQYQPMDAFDQVISIFAGIKGLLDDVEPEEVSAFEREMHAYLKEHHGELLSELHSKGDMDDDMKQRITTAINKFKATRQKG